MTLKSMTATFGRLNQAHLVLAPGLNLIHAPNEAGKSTWAAFLKAMLYGIDTRERDKKGYVAEKNRYQPWSGAPMEGELLLEWQGRDITLRRGPKGNTPFGFFSAVYTGTEEPVPGLTGENCGLKLLGVGREVYERSAFLGQGGSLSITTAPELEKRIAALVSSGEEDVSYSQVERRLKEWLNRRWVNKSVGRIPQLEEELRLVTAARQSLEQVNDALNRLEADYARLSREQSGLEEEMTIHQQLQRQELNRRFTQAGLELRQAKGQLEELHREQARFGTLPEREALKRAQGELAFLKTLDSEIRQGEEELERQERELEQARAQAQSPKFPNMSGEEAVQRAAAEVAAFRQAKEQAVKAGKQGRVVLGLSLAAAAGIGAGQLVMRPLPGPAFLWIALLAGCGLLLAYSLWLFGRSKGLSQEQVQILGRYEVDSPEAITALAQGHQQRAACAEQAAQQVRMVYGGLADRRARQENSRTDLLQFVHSFAPEVTDLFGCSAALSRALNLGERETVAQTRLEGAQRLYDTLKGQGGCEEDTPDHLEPPIRTLEETAEGLGLVQVELERVDRARNIARGRQKEMGDPTALAARQEMLEVELARRRQEAEAITLAMEVMEEANVQLQERFSPELNRRAAILLERLTGGAYTSLSLNREMEASASGAGDILPRRALFLSKGTVDQLYLAVRLAVYSMCMEPAAAPLVLDDALVAFDDARLRRALDLLVELAGQEQILLFTCQSREHTILAGYPHVAFLELAQPGDSQPHTGESVAMH